MGRLRRGRLGQVFTRHRHAHAGLADPILGIAGGRRDVAEKVRGSHLLAVTQGHRSQLGVRLQRGQVGVGTGAVEQREQACLGVDDHRYRARARGPRRFRLGHADVDGNVGEHDGTRGAVPHHLDAVDTRGRQLQRGLDEAGREARFGDLAVDAGQEQARVLEAADGLPVQLQALARRQAAWERRHRHADVAERHRDVASARRRVHPVAGDRHVALDRPQRLPPEACLRTVQGKRHHRVNHAHEPEPARHWFQLRGGDPSALGGFAQKPFRCGRQRPVRLGAVAARAQGLGDLVPDLDGVGPAHHAAFARFGHVLLRGGRKRRPIVASFDARRLQPGAGLRRPAAACRPRGAASACEQQGEEGGRRRTTHERRRFYVRAGSPGKRPSMPVRSTPAAWRSVERDLRRFSGGGATRRGASGSDRRVAPSARSPLVPVPLAHPVAANARITVMAPLVMTSGPNVAAAWLRRCLFHHRWRFTNDDLGRRRQWRGAER